MTRFALLLALTLPAAAAAQDDPWETHLYNVEFLTRHVQDYPGLDFTLAQDSIGAVVAGSESALSKGQLTGEDLVTLIKNNVAEDTWEHTKASLTFEGGALTVTNTKSVHARIRAYLAYWRGFFGKMITIDATIVAVDPILLARYRAAGNPARPMVLGPDLLKQLLDAAREGKNAELLKTMRVTAHPGQRVNLQDLHKTQYVRDVDVQIATAALALDPIIDLFTTGTGIDVRAFMEPFGNAVTLEVRAGRAEPEALVERKLRIAREINLTGLVEQPQPEGGSKPAAEPKRQGMASPAEPRLELPRLALDKARTTVTLKSRETGIVASTFRNGRNVLLLFTPAIIAFDDKPAPEPAFEEQRLLKLYDIAPLTRGVQDFAGPRLGLTTPAGGGGIPLTGASFTLEEPKMLMAEDSVVQLLKTRIAPETWGNKRNSLSVGPNGALMVRQKPEVLREIDQVLGALLFSRAQMISCETALIGFRKNARAEWEKEIPALAPGGYFVEQEKFDKLLEEAAKNQNVKLLEMAEIAGFPQERVFVARLQQESIVGDYEPQVSTAAVAFDPIVTVLSSGFVFDVRPHFVDDADRIAVGLRASYTRHDLREVEAAVPVASPLQAARGAEASWESDVLCTKGKWSLVGVFTRGRGDEAEDLALFLRARANVLDK